jgi:hypothetical protein
MLIRIKQDIDGFGIKVSGMHRDLYRALSDYFGSELPHEEVNGSYTAILRLKAKELIEHSRHLLCFNRYERLRKFWNVLVTKLPEDVSKQCVVDCVFRGGICSEALCCGHNQIGSIGSVVKDYIEQNKLSYDQKFNVYGK